MKIKRRVLLAGLAGSGASLEAQEPGSGSLYIPKAQRVEDRKFLHDFMDEFSFVELVTATPALRITHIPVFLDRTVGAYGKIYGHLSRQNPQSQTLDGRHSAVIVFRGPHSYISPTWYAKTEAVPTWNFAVVHASGRPQAVTEWNALLDLLTRLIAKYENHRASTYSFATLPDGYKSRLMAGIVGFEMEIESLEGKFKLGQEGSETDRQRLLRNLETARRERSLYDLTSSFYRRVTE